MDLNNLIDLIAEQVAKELDEASKDSPDDAVPRIVPHLWRLTKRHMLACLIGFRTHSVYVDRSPRAST